MPLSELTVGLVVRYDYIWHERPHAAATDDKDYPACVVATFRRQGQPEDFVVYLPISNTPPSGNEEGIELPASATERSGLDPRRQWVLVSECNLDTWPFDLHPISDQPGRYHFGHLPPRIFKMIRDRFVARYRAKQVSQMQRRS